MTALILPDQLEHGSKPNRTEMSFYDLLIFKDSDANYYQKHSKNYRTECMYQDFCGNCFFYRGVHFSN